MTQFAGLLSCMRGDVVEAGCDEAGRGCLAGPVFAAAVILPPDFRCDRLNDSKQLTERVREQLRVVIEREALAYAVAACSPEEIDRLNILWASIEAMHRALRSLCRTPHHILVDGNRFLQYEVIPHTCVVGGDGKYLSIAAASVLAKCWRDDHMRELDHQYPQYGWSRNKGYPTREHREAIQLHGITPHHRKSFALQERQLNIGF
ncbi:MAG: ribonuclease HII [bacterium]|jgi:ribonuclease HII|nr:ribonuclease HII [bacterium]MDD3624209.1 ribonuclease HII [Proteiniphilum sp.]MDD3967974.1 ribonuclease HII [Proteiniphilum sp.]MDD4458620.1 ribonuclease HII [Proteiniphilum sp.]